MSGETKPTAFGASLDPIEQTLPDALRPGTIIAGKYRVERVLGVGGMGVVLSVRHLDLGAQYAMKCLLPRGAADPESVERFLREARAAVRIESEHVVRVTDVGHLNNGSPYMLMEHLEGRDLAKILTEQHHLPIAAVVEYVLQACTGVAEAHALGIVHRDLKPANMFLTQRRDGPALVKILDFGISKAMDDGLHSPQLTQTSSVFGSPAYMSPEQVRSAKNVDYRTDVWALGVILFELLTGELPFVAETSGGLLSAIAADEPTEMRVYRTDVPPELEAVIRRCLAKKVAERFQNVSELASALVPFQGTKGLASVGRIRRLSSVPDLAPRTTESSSRTPLSVATDSTWTTGGHATRRTRNRLLLIGVTVGVVLGVGALVGVVRLRGDAPAPAAKPLTSEVIVPPPLPTTATLAATPPPTGAATSDEPELTSSHSAARRPPTTLPKSLGHAASSSSPASPSASAAAGATPPVAPAPALRDPTSDSH